VPSRRCACPRTRVPFRCSDGLCCTLFHSREPTRCGPTCKSAPKCCARARTFAPPSGSFAPARAPFRCSDGLRCALFHSRASMCCGPSWISALSHCPGARVFAPSCHSAWEHICAIFLHCPRVCICMDTNLELFPG
jgi:hypothetical protein